MAEDNPPRRGRLARFGLFELDVETGQLRREGVPVRVQDQPLRLLTYLADRPGELVTREELQKALWPADFVDFDHSLNTAIRKLRAALDDVADQPRFVETLARRGYRFIAPVTWADQEVKGAPSEPARPRNLRFAALLGAALAVIATVTIMIVRRPATPPAVIRSIAVLPFGNDDPATVHVSDGLTEILIDSLSRVPDVRVMARTTVFGLAEKKLDPLSAGRELGMDAVVVGNLSRAGGKRSVHVELIDVRDGAQLWGERYEITSADLGAVESRMATDLLQRLRPHGPPPPSEVATRNAEAYELYLRGLYLWNGRKFQQLPEAVKYFQRATELDPLFADAYAALAGTWGIMVGSGMITPAEGTPKVLAAARKALELDPRNARAYTSIAATESRSLWQFDAADRDFRRAIELNPGYATAHLWYAENLATTGRTAEARREADRGYELDPISIAGVNAKCSRYLYERRYGEAVAFARAAAKANPELGPIHCLAVALITSGDVESGLREAERGLVPAPDVAALRQAYRRGGIEAFLRLRLSQYMKETNRDVDIAQVLARLGQKDEAFEWLEKAYRKRLTPLASFHLLSGFDSLRSDPRFNDLGRRIGIPQAALDLEAARAKAAAASQSAH